MQLTSVCLFSRSGFFVTLCTVVTRHCLAPWQLFPDSLSHPSRPLSPSLSLAYDPSNSLPTSHICGLMFRLHSSWHVLGLFVPDYPSTVWWVVLDLSILMDVAIILTTWLSRDGALLFLSIHILNFTFSTNMSSLLTWSNLVLPQSSLMLPFLWLRHLV